MRLARHRKIGRRRSLSTIGPHPAASARTQGIELVVVKTPEAKHGFVLLPKRSVVERSFAWMSRCRRLARDCERLPAILIGLHFLAFACLMLHQLIHLFSSS
jgi:transposase